MNTTKHRKTDSSQKSRLPAVPRRNFNNLVEVETEKTHALLQLSAAMEKGNELKERELCLLEEKNNIEKHRNEILTTFTDNIAIVCHNFFEIFKNK